MKRRAFPLAIAALLLALAMPQAAHAFTVIGGSCPDLAVPAAALRFPERSSLETIRLQQETGLIAPPIDVAVSCATTQNLVKRSIEHGSTVSRKPDVFGSIALPVSHTPLDTKWRAANEARLSAHSGPWVPLIRAVAGKSRAEQLDSVNQWVNARLRFTDDRHADHWSGATETLRRSRGDCEDYAIAKMKLLEAAGVARVDMYLVIANDLVRRADHALLVVRLDERLIVLDSSTDQLLDAEMASDYRPIFSYGAQGAWVHGYAEQPVQIAAAF
jgi:predicted transglutaminase-like cysteine proteinase